MQYNALDWKKKKPTAKFLDSELKKSTTAKDQ